MSVWHIHMLNARHGLTRVLSEIRRSAGAAVAVASEHIEPPDFDLVVRPVFGGEIPASGMRGSSPAAGYIEITLAPDRFDETQFIRTMLRQIHHLVRRDGPGHGRSLGEALVSEGLAGHFVLHVLGGEPDRRMRTTPGEGTLRMAMNEWSRRDYDFQRWFHGGGDLRRWTGYGLGHRLVAEYLAENANETVVDLACANAEVFRPIMRRLAGAEKAGKTDETAAATDDGETG